MGVYQASTYLTKEVHQVEVRGEKTKDGIRFSWSDISRLFEMPATYHLSQKLDQQNMGVYQASTYLTYNGLLKIIFASRSGTAEFICYPEG